jgi:hypothetical protein
MFLTANHSRRRGLKFSVQVGERLMHLAAIGVRSGFFA